MASVSTDLRAAPAQASTAEAIDESETERAMVAVFLGEAPGPEGPVRVTEVLSEDDRALQAGNVPPEVTADVMPQALLGGPPPGIMPAAMIQARPRIAGTFRRIDPHAVRRVVSVVRPPRRACARSRGRRVRRRGRRAAPSRSDGSSDGEEGPPGGHIAGLEGGVR